MFRFITVLTLAVVAYGVASPTILEAASLPGADIPGASNVDSVGVLRASGIGSDDNTPAAACSPNEKLLTKAERYRALNHRPPGYGRSWRQVLLFFGVDHEYNGTDPVKPVTLALMDERVGRWSGWKQFRDEVARLLDCGWTPGVQDTSQPETEQPETQQPQTQQPKPQQAEPQQASAPHVIHGVGHADAGSGLRHEISATTYPRGNRRHST